MLGPEAEKRLEGGHRSTAPIEAIGELVEVGLEMAMANAVMGAAEPRLQIAEERWMRGRILTARSGSPCVRGRCLYPMSESGPYAPHPSVSTIAPRSTLAFTNPVRDRPEASGTT